MLAHSLHGEFGDSAVVMLHSLALDRSVWDGVINQLDGVPCVAVDLRGHGESRGSGQTTIEEMGVDVVELIEYLGLASVVVVGLSLGGCVAQVVAASRPDLVAHLVLADTTAWYGPDAVEAWTQRAGKAQADGLNSLSAFQLDRWFGDEFLEEHPAIGEALLDIFRANDIDEYVATCSAMGKFDFRPRLGDIDCPTTVLVGELDPATPIEDAEALVAGIPTAELQVLRGARHLTAIERPNEFADVIRAARVW